MFLSPTMRNAVLQATIISTISMMHMHHFTDNMFDPVFQDETWMQMMNTSTMQTSTPGGNGRLTLDTGNRTNTTLSLNQTAPAGLANGTATNDLNEAFYGRFLLREIVVSAVFAALEYWWLIGLERILPGRPRNKDVLSQLSGQVEESEDREEEVVKKWIAQGRVRRASLNWGNTLLKWVLDLTVGRLWLHTVEYYLRMLIKFGAPWGLKTQLGMAFFSTYVSFSPLARLVAFIIIPAHKQVVFIGGFELVVSIFFDTIGRLFAAWVIKTDWMKKFMQNEIKKREGQVISKDEL
ncbi:hypothetical protein CC86DRAFT_314923 [Ophiobolus disseminans]|uniref:Uncharacterized protein n=1 Tax=Ophiobolus disseminans TaxID=1469910 RepID=A0A6A7ADX1_9PLEO|nr:hypothetical protein CC86DRAFT_314923 [Ophiobolus disseminans]